MGRARRTLLAVCFFVCPLVFFTNLTRNPYITQICLLNICLLLAASAYCAQGAAAGERGFPRTPLDAPLACWAAVCALSWAVAYFGHLPFFRPAIVNEGTRNFLFLAANTACPFFLAAASWREDDSLGPVALAPWVVLVACWGALWTGFPLLRGPSAAAVDIGGHVWDGYGAFVWAAGLAGVLWLCRKGRWVDFMHLALAAGFLASVYGVCQYFNFDFIWPYALNPYGGRSVSTFGNPNFMSSFDAMLWPVAAAFFLTARGPRRWVYAAAALALEAALLCSLTRSSWLGALAALGVLLLSPEARRAIVAEPQPAGLFFGAAVALALLWPQSSVSAGYAPSVLDRLHEVGQAASGGTAYGPWHQRVLIWTCGWLMGAENPLTGKGWGLFELFYPFYQGHILAAFDFYRDLRTHANNAHNELVETWAQTGLLGVGVLAWLWTTFFSAAWREAKARGAQQIVVFALIAGVAGMLVDNMLNVSLHFAVPGLLFWWLAGSAMGAVRPRTRERRWARPAAALAAAVLAGFSWYWVKVWNREVRYFAGFKLMRQGALSAAVRELELSRSWGPPEVNSLYELGNSYARSDRFPEADRAYRAALDANAGYDEIYFNVGTLNSAKLGRDEDAIRNFETALWINPVSNDVYGSLSTLYLRDPQRYGDRALPMLRQAVHFFPDNANHWNNLGYLLTLDRRYDEAEKAYVQALTINPAMETARGNLESMTVQARRPRPAILSHLEKLRELERRVAGRDFSDATLALARHMVATFPEMAKARFFLGSLELARGRPADAVPLLEWAAAREPSHFWARLNLGTAYMGLGRNAEAARELRAALELQPANALAQERLKSLGPL